MFAVPSGGMAFSCILVGKARAALASGQISAKPGTTNMAYDIPPPKKLPEPGYYYHFKHDLDGPVNNYAYTFTASAITPKRIADPKMPSCKCTGHYTRR